METFHPSENDSPQDVSSAPTESLSPRGISAMQGGEAPPLPRPDNPETIEISQTPEATPGRDDGIAPAAPAPADDATPVDPSQADRQRIEAALGRLSVTAGDDTLAPANDNSREAAAIDSLRQLDGIQPERWEQLGEAERLSVLQDAESRMAQIQERPSASVDMTPAGPGSFGFYDPKSNQIHIGSYALENAGPRENLDTMVHEGRHAYQQFAVSNPGFHPNQAEVDAWRENLKPGNYLSAEVYGQELYQSQPVEADAWNYARNITDGVYGGE